MSEIRINFLEIIPHNFKIKVFSKPFEEGDKNENIFKYRLPKSRDQNSIYDNFSVSFSEMSSFTATEYLSSDNIFLTQNFILNELARGLEKLNPIYEWKVYSEKFNRKIEFIIEKNQKGDRIVIMSPYYLKIQNKFGFLIDYKFNKKEDVPFDRDVQRLSLSLDKNFQENKNYYYDKYLIIDGFLNNFLSQIIPKAYVTIGLNIVYNLTSLQEYRLAKKQYLFQDNKPNNSQFQGIRSNGPFQKIEKEPYYAFVFEEKFKSFANQIYLSLLGKTNPGTFPGLEKMFRLSFQKENVGRFQLENYQKSTLEKVTQKIIEYQNNNPEKKVIALFIEPKKDDLLVPNLSPYYILKYELIKNNLPLQVISYERMNQPNGLKWSTSNIGLQIFSKLGGIPWILEPTNKNCLILGIGTSHEIDSYGKTKKYFAYTVCLDSTGLYKNLEVLSEESNKATYLKELKENLINILNSEDLSSYDKCALHIPFKIKQSEIDSIEMAINQIHHFDFKVIKINTKNRFFGYSNHNTLIPYESSYIMLSKSEYLVWFDGLSYGKENVNRRVGNPIHVEFLKSQNTSGDENNKDYLQDVINLSGANWRGFNAKQIPISIYYSKIVADYTKAFSEFDDFEQNILTNNLPWFL